MFRFKISTAPHYLIALAVTDRMHRHRNFQSDANSRDLQTASTHNGLARTCARIRGHHSNETLSSLVERLHHEAVTSSFVTRQVPLLVLSATMRIYGSRIMGRFRCDILGPWAGKRTVVHSMCNTMDNLANVRAQLEGKDGLSPL